MARLAIAALLASGVAVAPVAAFMALVATRSVVAIAALLVEIAVSVDLEAAFTVVPAGLGHRVFSVASVIRGRVEASWR